MRPVLLALTVLVAASCSRDPAELPAEDVVQSGCERNDDCVGGRCVQGLPDGLCTVECATQDECPEGTVCTDTEATQGVCLFSCTAETDCSELVGDGYTCDEETNLTTGADIRVCIDA